MTTIKLKTPVERNAVAIACECNGFADQIACTTEEADEYGCFRDKGKTRSSAYSCCARAFKCRLCGARLVGSAEAPESN